MSKPYLFIKATTGRGKTGNSKKMPLRIMLKDYRDINIFKKRLSQFNDNPTKEWQNKALSDILMAEDLAECLTGASGILELRPLNIVLVTSENFEVAKLVF